MATQIVLECPACGPARTSPRLFHLLKEWAEGHHAPQCATCGAALTVLLQSPFAFGAAADMRVLAVFSARRESGKIEWDHEGHHIEFHPFLVITSRSNGGAGEREAAWLPYWHVDRFDGRTRLKYGQWAPNMELRDFADLVAQARGAGYLAGGDVATAPLG